MGFLGYTKRVSFKTGINLSQISEFSIVMIVLATAAGLVRSEISAIITLVAIITIATSTYLMHYDDELFAYFDRIKIKLFEKEVTRKEKRNRGGYPLLLFGYHHGGHEFIRTFREIGKRFLVIDYDPSVIETLEQQQVPFMYGDATDNELLEEIGLDNTKLIISTFSDFEVSQQLVKNVTRLNPSTVIISHANNHNEAIQLYELGSTYVMIPHHIGTEKISAFIKKSGLRKTEFNQFREKHLAYLQSRYEIISPAA
jgi:voltage-gated potassium channel Kch